MKANEILNYMYIAFNKKLLSKYRFQCPGEVIRSDGCHSLLAPNRRKKAVPKALKKAHNDNSWALYSTPLVSFLNHLLFALTC